MEGPAGVTAGQLKQFIERIERLIDERQTITDDIADVFAEAKATGYDVKIMKQVIKIRAQDKAEREEQEALLDLYLSQLGMIYVPAAEDAA